MNTGFCDCGAHNLYSYNYGVHACLFHFCDSCSNLLNLEEKGIRIEGKGPVSKFNIFYMHACIHTHTHIHTYN